MKKEITTEIEINASPEKVWNILSDFKNYPKWNPFILFIQGELKQGAFLEVKLQPDGGKPMVFKPIVLEAEKNKVFCWKGKLLVKGLFDGEHRFELITKPKGGTLFIHSEKFSGILVSFFQKMIDGSTKRSFESMNRQLKLLAELK